MVGIKSVAVAASDDLKKLPRQTVLLIGDTPDDLALVCALLQGMPCKVLPALAHKRIEPMFSRKDVAVILLNNSSTAANFALARQLRNNPRTRHIPLLLITSALQEDDPAHLGDFNDAIDYLLHPINPVLLRSKIAMLLELADNRRCLACLHDVSKSLQDQLDVQVITDTLTGLLNRHGFTQALENELARAQRHHKLLPVLYVDLDGFKRINDAFGHLAGDNVLRTVAARMRDVLRPYDRVAHLGGDEFAILAEGVGSEDQIAHIAEKILDALALPHTIKGLQITVGASVGIAVYPDSAKSADAIMRAAGLAMQRAKSESRNSYRFYSVEMNGRARARLMLEQSLRRAIAEQEFELYFQPQMHMGSGHLRGFEALLRWRHVTAGMVQPGVFVPVLEEAGFINMLGPWIIDATCRQIADWQQVLPPQSCVALNLSSMQFAQRDLVANVAAAIKHYAIDPHQLELEVTESTLITDVEHTRLVLRQLRELGIRSAIDDFGTGYSSMAYLRQFEVDTLKIDKVFVSGLPRSGRDAAIAQSITQLGHNLGMEIIAEGVETLEQFDWLRSIGCDVAQGYYFSRPEPPGTVPWSFRAA